MNQTGIYIHIPFCVRKCNYCDFLSFPAGEEERNRYICCLVQEIERSQRYFPENRQVDTVFLGGGTPSILSLRQVEQILKALRQTFIIADTAEITAECNPGTVDLEFIRGLFKNGVNRISFGVQSAVDSELQTLGRIHRFQDAKESVAMAREAGFENINIDVMSAVPGQTKKSYSDTLTRILELKPEHISAYSLIIEEGTPFYEKYGEVPPVDEETDRWMYAATKERLAACGYERYEISNYARRGYECRHNLKYWSGEDYIGFGLGASSKVGVTRYHNESDMTQYLEKIQREDNVAYVEEVLSTEEQMSEYMILGLRKTRGISLNEFKNQFGIPVDDIYGKQIETFMADGLLQRERDRLFFTDHGLDVSNLVLCELI